MTNLLVGTVLLLLGLLVIALDAHAGLSGWLAAFLLMSSLPLGALCLSLMLRIIPGPWQAEMTGPANEAILLLPVLPLLVLPALLGIYWLYPWAGQHMTGFKGFYLTPVFFGIRALAILIAAAALGALFRRTGSYRLAIAGLIVFVLLDGVLSIDLALSLVPSYHSSGFGLYFLCLQTLIALCLLIVARLPFTNDASILGRLLLTSLLLWAYFSFMQYFISWSTNLVPGVKWYALRGNGIWAIAEYAMISIRLVAGLLLFFPPVRNSRTWLACLCGAVLLGGVIEIGWLVLPSASPHPALALISYLLAAAGFGFAAWSGERLLIRRRI